MEEILDRQFNRKDETRINHGIAIIRLITCLCLSHLLFNLLKSNLPDTEIIDTVLAVGIIVVMISVVIYNFFRVISEVNQRFFILSKKRIFVLIMIINQLILAVILGLVWSSRIRLIFTKEYLPITWKEVEIVIIIVGLSIITFREIICFKRATRLKQLKTTKP